MKQIKFRLLLITLLILTGTGVLAQLNVPVNQRVTINFIDSVVYADILTNDNKVKVHDDLYYYWFSSNDIKRTRGDFAGKLLHGNYTEFYPNKNLKEKGVFRYGLKNGKWKSWHLNGELNEIIKWKKGKQHGDYQLFNEQGQLIEKGNYRYGEFNGKIYKYQSNGCVTVEKYKKGTLKKEKDKCLLFFNRKQKNTKEIKPKAEDKKHPRKKKAETKDTIPADNNSQKKKKTEEKPAQKKQKVKSE